MAAAFMHSLGESAHQAVASAAINKADPSLGHGPSKRLSGRLEARIAPSARAAIHA
jgi:hypothetical protein